MVFNPFGLKMGVALMKWVWILETRSENRYEYILGASSEKGHWKMTYKFCSEIG